MTEHEIRYNEYGEVLPDEEWDEATPPRIQATWSRPLNDAVMAVTVMNYRRNKNPAKLSHYERAMLNGEPWTPPLNKRQRERLAASRVEEER